MKKKKKLLIGISVCAIIVCIIVLNNLGKNEEKVSTTSEDKYDVEILKKQTLVNSISSTGKFASNEKTTISSDLANSKIETVSVEVGDQVKKGDIICKFDPEDLNDSLEQAIKDLNRTKKQNEIARKTAERNVSSAKTNRTNQYDMATDSIGSAKDSWTTSTNERKSLNKQHNVAKKNVETYQNALKSINQLTHPKEYAAAQTALVEVKTTEATVKAQYKAAVTTEKTAKSTYEKLKKDRSISDTANANNIATLEDTLENTKLTSNSSIDTLQNQIDSYRKKLKKTIVKATSDGIITSLSVSDGQTYMGSDICVIESPTDLIITAEIEEYEISNILEDMKVKVKTDVTGDEVLDGTVIYVSPIASSATMASGANSSALSGAASMAGTGSTNVTYKIKVRLNDTNEKIRLGMTAKMSIVADEVKNVFAVPYDAIQENKANEKVVYALIKGQKKEKDSKKEIKVKTGIESSYYVEIIGSDLKEGMSICVPTNSSDASMDAMMDAMKNSNK